MSNTTRINPKALKVLRDGSKVHATKSCGNHGGCPICEGNRLRQRRVSEKESFDKLTNWWLEDVKELTALADCGLSDVEAIKKLSDKLGESTIKPPTCGREDTEN